MLISDDYRALNTKMHADDGAWGRQAVKTWEQVHHIAAKCGLKKLLDYGCGKQMLRQCLEPLGYEVTCYDPAFPETATPPEPHDFVVCMDVLEHIEPECLADVLKDLQRVILDVGFFMVATRPSIKTLPDGSNCHRIVEPMEWWLKKLSEYFEIGESLDRKGRVFGVIVGRKKAPSPT